MKTSKTLQWVTGGLEAFLAIPFVGGTFILSMAWTPLAVMLVLHIITLIFCSQENESRTGSMTGIAASILGWIPFVGWFLHLVAAIMLLLQACRRPNHGKYIDI